MNNVTKIKEYLAAIPLVQALWWFIENIGDDIPSDVRSELFFELRERYRKEIQV